MASENKQDGDQDLSMEEILQSIRKIIADEGEGVPPEPTNGTDPVPGSDVLELTEMVPEEEAAPAAPPAPAEPPPVDILASIDQALAPPPPPPAPPAPPPAPVVAAPVAAPVADMVVEPAEHDPDSLLSEQTAAASSEALRKVAMAKPTPPPIPSPNFRTGSTVEELVIESIKPMLKEWLDQNLPTIVERIVEKEVRKLAAD